LSKEIINEYKDQVKSLTERIKELTKELDDKDAKIKRQLILLEQKDSDLRQLQEKISETKETVNKL
tara:strand:- start:311 stop:508 length:198 start_codon:yes stop_codon:yes gene_type:complete